MINDYDFIPALSPANQNVPWLLNQHKKAELLAIIELFFELLGELPETEQLYVLEELTDQQEAHLKGYL